MNSRKLALALFATWLGCAIGAVIAHFFITPDVSLNQMTFVTAALGAAFYTVKLGYGSAPAEKRPATESSPFRSEPDAMLMAEVERLKEENAKAAKENDKLRLSTPYFAVSVGAIVTMILFGLVLIDAVQEVKADREQIATLQQERDSAREQRDAARNERDGWQLFAQRGMQVQLSSAGAIQVMGGGGGGGGGDPPSAGVWGTPTIFGNKGIIATNNKGTVTQINDLACCAEVLASGVTKHLEHRSGDLPRTGRCYAVDDDVSFCIKSMREMYGGGVVNCHKVEKNRWTCEMKP